ncbi:oxidoreductase [Colletotrichum truncatum]|uniref:Oxidoreductase n=1 Tax=Colletotrichum truncatum TaxID=5467 RepID=A0ACC3ZKX8_COLTU|nr:oxidoreductase [Colletotrichum truncatum]KAF6786915.1 oxidoreductase [Colletotrichum truncatum]
MTDQRPKLLCLHGGGANAMIFEIQLIRLQRALNSRFDLVFLDAPIETAPGPGVLPVFEGCEPYRRWVSDDTATPEDEFQAQKDKAMDILKTYMKEKGPFAGLVGFSQGARAASSLLLEQQREPFVDGKLFGVFLCGTFPPFVPHEEIITAPTVHVIGLEDFYKPLSEQLYEHCSDKVMRRVMRFPGGHHLPTSPEALQVIASMILGAYKESTRD